MDDSIFQHNTKLKSIILSDNEILEIQPAVFANLKKLRALFLSGNKLTSFNLKDLSDSMKITVLELHNNKLRTLNGYEDTLAIMPDLKVCTIEGNDFNLLYWIWVFETFDRLMIKCCDFNHWECLFPESVTRVFQLAMNTQLRGAIPFEPEWMKFRKRRPISAGSSRKHIKIRKIS